MAARKPPKPPDRSKDARARLAAALKENLKRRKAQARGRAADEDAVPEDTRRERDDEPDR